MIVIFQNYMYKIQWKMFCSSAQKTEWEFRVWFASCCMGWYSQFPEELWKSLPLLFNIHNAMCICGFGHFLIRPFLHID